MEARVVTVAPIAAVGSASWMERTRLSGDDAACRAYCKRATCSVRLRTRSL